MAAVTTGDAAQEPAVAVKDAVDNEKDAMETDEAVEGSEQASEEVIAAEKAELESHRNELTARYAQLDALLKGNEDPSACAEHPPFAKTDSSLKRNTAFVKKLKNYSEAQREAIMRELPALNLTKYQEEVAGALLEARLRAADLPAVLLLHCLMARNYADYAELSLDAWRRLLLPGGGSGSSASMGQDTAKQQQQVPPQQQQHQWNLAKLRVDLRLYADLILTRVLPRNPGLKLLGQCLQALTLTDTEFSHCGLVCHLLCHAGDPLIGCLPTNKAQLATRYPSEPPLPRGTAYLDPEARRPFHRLLSDYGRRLVTALTERATELAQMDRANRRILRGKGELAQERRDAFETGKKEMDRLLGLANQLCNLLGEPPPSLPPIGADDLDEEERAVADALSAPAGAGRLPGLDEATGLGRFEDEDARQFYEMLPDLRPMLPEVLLRGGGGSETARERSCSGSGEKAKEGGDKQQEKPATAITEKEPPGSEAKEMEGEDKQHKAAEADPKEEADQAEENEEDEEAKLEKELAAEEEAAAAAAASESATASDAADGSGGATEEAAGGTAETSSAAAAAADEAAPATSSAAQQRQAQLEQFLTALPTLINRDLIDKAALQFATALNSKSARRRLSQAMAGVHRGRSDLLPFYARLAAVLRPAAPEVADELRARLQADFRHAFHKKDHTNLESKLKTVRFIGELVKFGLFPLTDAAANLKLLVINFSNHNIELACTLLESCGRYLYATQETHLRMKVYLRNLWNKKTKLVTDERLAAMIENAYYSVVPPDASRQIKPVQLPPVMQFLQRLLFKELCNSNVEKTLRLCLRLPWSDPAIRQFAIRCFSSPWSAPYGAIHCLASVLAGLAPFYQSAAIAAVDAVLEDIRLGMEINVHRLNQRRVACARYLGELYNYCLVESGPVFNTLYSFLTLGQGDSELDPPQHLLRIRLACTLLQTCGQYFDTGSNKRRLDAFLLYLQQYYWAKRAQPVWSPEERPFPLDIEYLYLETVDSLRPKFKHAASWEEARGLVERQEKAFLAKLERVASKLQQHQQHHQHLHSISESESEARPTPAGGGGGGSGTATATDEEEEENEDGDSEEDEADTDQDDGAEGRRGGGHRRGRRAAAGQDGDGDDAADADDDDEEEEDGTGSRARATEPRPELMACPEDDDFVRAFERTLASEGAAGLGSGGGSGGGGGGGAASSAAVLQALQLPASASAASLQMMDSSVKAAAQAGAAGEQDDSDTPPAPPPSVPFTVVSRRGGPLRSQPVVRLPADSALARRYLAAAEAAAEEREAVKRATLSITEAQMRQEEADEADAAADAAAAASYGFGPATAYRGRGGGGRRQGGARNF